MATLKCSVCDATFADVGMEYRIHATAHIENGDSGGFEIVKDAVFSQTDPA